jgi:hypothetical protein
MWETSYMFRTFPAIFREVLKNKNTTMASYVINVQ